MFYTILFIDIILFIIIHIVESQYISWKYIQSEK